MEFFTYISVLGRARNLVCIIVRRPPSWSKQSIKVKCIRTRAKLICLAVSRILKTSFNGNFVLCASSNSKQHYVKYFFGLFCYLHEVQWSLSMRLFILYSRVSSTHYCVLAYIYNFITSKQAESVVVNDMWAHTYIRSGPAKANRVCHLPAQFIDQMKSLLLWAVA